MNRVIKISDSLSLNGGTGLRVRPVDLRQQFSKPEAEARDIISIAREEADAIVQSARAEADSIRSRAHEQGFASGIREAARAAEEMIARIESDVAAISEDKRAIVESVEAELLKLCTEIVEKIIRHEIRTDPRVVVRTIKSCLRRITGDDGVCVRVSPEEIEQVKAAREELLGLVDGASNLRIVEDRRISSGGCRVESASGSFDARIETQIERINDKLGETFANGHGANDSGPDKIPPGDQPA